MLGRCPEVAFFEVVAEACLVDRTSRREVESLVHRAPVIPHGVKLSLGSAEGIDNAHLDRIATLCKQLRAPCFSEHVSFVRSGGTEIGHLTPLPRTRDALAVITRNVEAARRRLPDIPLLLENVANPFFWPGDEMTEAQFYQEVVRRTGCDLLLDVSNLYANARNQGLDPLQALAEFPLERVRLAHVAGGKLEGGFYFDTHAHAITPAIHELVTRLLQANPAVPLLLERDANFEGFDLAAEMRALANHGSSAPEVARSVTPTATPTAALPPRIDSPSTGLANLQSELAQLLTSATTREEIGGMAAPQSQLASAIGKHSLQRTRTILERKRVEDALPLLPRLARVDTVQALAERVVRGLPRLPSRNAIRDAFEIARAATGDSALAPAADLDRLLLRARVHERSLLPRFGPFVGWLQHGATLYIVVKPVGASSTVHLWSKRIHGRLSPAADSSLSR